MSGNPDYNVASGGTLILEDGSDDSLGTGDVTINSGGELRFKKDLSNNITIAGTGTGNLSPSGAIINTSNSNTISGKITLSADATIAARSGAITIDTSSGDAIDGTGAVSYTHLTLPTICSV